MVVGCWTERAINQKNAADFSSLKCKFYGNGFNLDLSLWKYRKI
jgi:hypothetical protein